MLRGSSMKMEPSSASNGKRLFLHNSETMQVARVLDLALQRLFSSLCQ
jgi:hypothetical protein